MSEAEAEVLVELGIFSFVFVTIDDHVGVSEGGADGPEALHAPLSGDHAMDEFEFDVVGGLKRIDIPLQKFFKKGVILIAEDDRSGGEAVLETV